MAASNHARRENVRACKMSCTSTTSAPSKNRKTISSNIGARKSKKTFTTATTRSVFILISFVLLVNSYIDRQPSDHEHNRAGLFRPMRADAGSKSKEKSSKTTVIAISGGQQAKPHPVPVPWPVIHCHHHHHHLKYVPKPVLVHHWVKKQKALPIEIHESSNEHYQVMDSRGGSGVQPHAHIPTMALLPTEQQQQQQQQHQVSFLGDASLAQQTNIGSFAMAPNGNNHLLPKVPFPDLMDGSQLVSALSNELDMGGGNLLMPPVSGTSNPFADSPSLEMAPLTSKFKQTHSGANFSSSPTKFSDKQLDKLTKSILSAQQKGKKQQSHNKPPRDADSGLDSLKSNVVAVATTGSSSQIDAINGTFYGLDGYDFGSQSSSDQSTNGTRYGQGGKPSHPFDDLQDQLKDESSIVTEAAAATRAPPAQIISRQQRRQQQQELNSANLREEANSRQVYQRLALESARQLAALNEADRQRALAGLMLAGPQQQQQQQHLMMAPLQLGQNRDQVVAAGMPPAAGGQHLFNAQAANQRTMSESHAISLMTHLAERMAQLEANNLVERHRLAAASSLAANRSAAPTSGPKKSSTGTSNLFGGGFLNNFNLFSRATPVRLRATIGHDRDPKRRHSSGGASQVTITKPMTTSKSTPSSNYQRFLTWQSTSTTTQAPVRATQPISANQLVSAHTLNSENNDYNIITASPLYINLAAPSVASKYRNLRNNQMAAAYGQRHTAPVATTRDQSQEKLLSEGSSQVNNIAQPASFARPPPGFSTSAAASAQQPKRFFGSAASRPPPAIGQQSQTQQHTHKTQASSPTRTTTPPGATPTTTPQMSPDQESNFYLGQREHLASESVEAASSTSSSLLPPSPNADQQAPVSNLTKQVPSGSSLPLATSGTSMSSSAPSLAQAYTPEPSNVVGQTVAAAPGDAQYQQQPQTSFTPTPEQLQPFLQFPMSPAQWSSEALRSLNTVEQRQQQQVSNDQATSAASEDLSNEQQVDGQDSSSSSSSGEQQQQDKTLSLDANDGQAHTYYLDANGNLESATSGSDQQPQSQNQPELSQFPEQMQFLQQQQQQQAMLMAASGEPQMATPPWPFGGHAQFQTPPNFLGQQVMASEPAAAATMSMQQPAYGYYTSGVPLDSSWPPTSGSSMSAYDARMHQHLLAQSFPALAAGTISAAAAARTKKMVAPPGGGTNMDQFVASSLASPMNEMNQLRAFQGRLSGGGGVGSQGVGNFSGLAGSLGGRLLPNQMQSRFPPAGAGQMPQIPNIPQPPQIPNLPMPPPGMMQMAASVALPLAMARATRQQNRFRNNQVNSAAAQGGASSGGTTAGQRFLRGASNLTNRFMRTRRRPSSTSSRPALAAASASGPTTFNRQHRRRRPSALLTSLATNTNRVSQLFGRPSPATPLLSPAASAAAAAVYHRRPQRPMGVRFIQTVVDMSRRPPPMATVAGNLAASATTGVLSAATKATAAASVANPTGSQANAARGVAAATKVISSVASAAAAASGAPVVDKLKPKMDHIHELQGEVSTRPAPRTIVGTRAHISRGGSASTPSSVVFGGLPPVALTDGTLHRFESMNSPVDLMNRQLRRARELEWQRQQHQTQRAQTARAEIEMHARLHQPQLELLRLSAAQRGLAPSVQYSRTPAEIPSQSTFDHYYQLITSTPTPQTTQFETSTSGAVAPEHEQVSSGEHAATVTQPDLTPVGPVNSSTFHVPQVVTNHFNLLMFTNKNVTGNLLAPPTITQTSNASENEQPTESPTTITDVASNASGQGEPEQQVASFNQNHETMSKQDNDDEEQRRQYELQQQLQQQAHEPSRIEPQPQPASELPQSKVAREFTASNAIDSSQAARPASPSKQEARAPGGMILIKMTQQTDERDQSGTSESKENRRTIKLSSDQSAESAQDAEVPAIASVVEQKTTTKAPARRKLKKKAKSSDEKSPKVITAQSPTTTTTTTTTTTAAPTIAKKPNDDYATSGSQWTEVRAGTDGKESTASLRVKKMSNLKTTLTKRSTSVRPTGPAIENVESPTSPQGAESVEAKLPPREMTNADGEQLTGGDKRRRPTLAPVAQAQAQTFDSGQQSAADYVRAIKLVRGVAYPWPPPTQSSKALSVQATISGDEQILETETLPDL